MYPAFIFDFNGTLTDDTQNHIQAWMGVVGKYGKTIDYDEMKANWYGSNEEMLERIFPKRFDIAQKKAIGQEKETLYRNVFASKLEPISGLVPFLVHCKNKGKLLAVGSSAASPFLDYALRILGIRPFFDVIISGDDVSKGKPHPETFLKCAEILGIPPHDCVVFEDTPKGVSAAKSANMQAIALLTTYHHQKFEVFDNILLQIENYDDKRLYELLG